MSVAGSCRAQRGRPAAIGCLRKALSSASLIKQLQEMGFSLDEIKQLFGSGGGVNQCRAIREFLLEKLSAVEDRMNQIRDFKKVLRRRSSAWAMLARDVYLLYDGTPGWIDTPPKAMFGQE